jgi:hypothetical protein
MGVVIQALRDSARGEACTIQLAGICNHDPDTTVLCHTRHHAGTGIKTSDWNAFYACSACHAAIDNHELPLATEAWQMLRGIQRTHDRFYEKGLMVFPSQRQPPDRPFNKIVPRPAQFRR